MSGSLLAWPCTCAVFPLPCACTFPPSRIPGRFSLAKPLNSSQFTFSILLNWVSWNIWISLKIMQVIFEQKPCLMKDSTIRELDKGGLNFPSVSPWIWLDWKCRTSGVQQSDEALLRSCNWWDCAHTLIALCKAVKLTSDGRVTTKPLWIKEEAWMWWMIKMFNS